MQPNEITPEYLRQCARVLEEAIPAQVNGGDAQGSFCAELMYEPDSVRFEYHLDNSAVTPRKPMYLVWSYTIKQMEMDGLEMSPPHPMLGSVEIPVTPDGTMLLEGVDFIDGLHLATDNEEADTEPQVVCSVCKNLCSGHAAHLHQGEWIGDECCWDERLRSSE